MMVVRWPVFRHRSDMWKLLRRLLKLVAVLVLLAAVTAGGIWWYLSPTVARTNGIPYGQRNGQTIAITAGLSPQRSASTSAVP